MKKIILLLIVLVSFSGWAFSQKAPVFKLTKNGIDPVVVNFDKSLTDSVIYTRVKDWIAANNKSPKSVTRIDQAYSLVKFSCFKEKAWKIRDNDYDYWSDLKYTIKVEIKDYKCRLTFATDDDHYKFWFNDNGTLKDKFKESKALYEKTVNETLSSLYNYIVAPPKKETSDW